MQVQEIVDSVASQVGVPTETAEKAVGTILSVLSHEVGSSTLAPIMARIPGASELAQQYDVAAASAGGGLLGSLTSVLGASFGEKAGALVNGVTQLESLGLTLDQVRQAGGTLLQKARQAAGANSVDKLLSQNPAIASHFG